MEVKNEVNWCELCMVNPSQALYVVLDSHVFSKEPSKMWLCHWCARGLGENGVRIKKISPSYPAEKN